MKFGIRAGLYRCELHEYMLTKNKLQIGKGNLKSFDPKAGCAPQRRNMADEEDRWEEERNYCKEFYNMAEKVDKFFLEHEKAIKHEKKDVDEHGSVNHGGDGEESLPSHSSSDSSSSFSHHSNKNHRHTSKKSFFKLDVKF